MEVDLSDDPDMSFDEDIPVLRSKIPLELKETFILGEDHDGNNDDSDDTVLFS